MLKWKIALLAFVNIHLTLQEVAAGPAQPYVECKFTMIVCLNYLFLVHLCFFSQFLGNKTSLLLISPITNLLLKLCTGSSGSLLDQGHSFIVIYSYT